jgi:hypothetical protein
VATEAAWLNGNNLEKEKREKRKEKREKRKERTLDTLLPARSVWVEPLDYEWAVVVDAERQRKQNKTTRGSEWRSVLKKSLPESALLEMDGLRANPLTNGVQLLHLLTE